MKRIWTKSLSLYFLWLLSCSSPSSEPAIRIRIPQDPESLHPISYGNAYALQIINLAYQSLLTVNLEDRSIQPLLAAKLPTVRREDTLSYFTFQIRPQARWDNGSPVTAADVAFSLKLLHSPLLDNDRWRAQYDFIKDVQLSSKNPLEVTLVCSGYTPEMKLMTGDFFVLPTYKLDTNGLLSSIPYMLIRNKYDSLASTSTFKNLAKRINSPELGKDTSWVKGSGPYTLTSWRNGQSLLLEKKKNWWGSSVLPQTQSLRANPNKLNFLVIPDDAAAVISLKTNQIDILDEIPLVPFREIQKDQEYRKKFNFYTPLTFDLAFMGLNGQNPVLKDKRTRQALGYLLNIPQIIKSIHGGLAVPTNGFVHPDEKQFYNASLPPLKLDLRKASEYLISAGWQRTNNGWMKEINGRNQQLKLNLLYRAGNTEFENMGILYQQNAKQLGIPVTLQALEGSQISERLGNRSYDAYFRTLVGNPFSYNLTPLFHTSNSQLGGSNVTGFGTPETDDLLEKIAKEERTNEKAALLKSLQQKMREESNLIFLFFLQNRIAVSNKIDSVVVSGLKPGYDITKLTIKK